MLSDTVPEPFSIFALANRNRKRVSRGKGEMGWRRKQKVEQKVELGVTLIKKKGGICKSWSLGSAPAL